MFKVEILEAVACPNYTERRMDYHSIRGVATHKRSVKRAVELAKEAFKRDNKRQGWPCGSTVFGSTVISKGGKEISYKL